MKLLSLTSSRQIIFSVVVMGALILIALFSANKLPQNTVFSAAPSSDSPINPKLDKEATVNAIQKAETPAINPPPRDFSLTSAERPEYEKWSRERGYEANYLHPQPSDYDAYDLATLERLAEANDMLAIHKLNDKLLSGEYTPDRRGKTKALRLKAAMLGSTKALVDQGIFERCRTDAGHTEDEVKECRLNSLAYTKAAALRGDMTFYHTTLKEIDRGDFVVTADDAADINKRARTILSTLEDERIKLGLGSFDNTIPPSVKRFNDFYDVRKKGIKEYF